MIDVGIHKSKKFVVIMVSVCKKLSSKEFESDNLI